MTRHGIDVIPSTQPPSGGCVLKLNSKANQLLDDNQPPSGGCVLKPQCGFSVGECINPAAFGRLCVETGASTLKFVAIIASRLRAAVC